ncbi:phosphonate metabolism protein/1,5-bisphosphokinase (PRPP-forming) PhnN [Aurantimonas sp. Leaf443]|uniref:phosphonate metabolism protein/1,5-bisphosphokinase (PRPP-forming) PhnN n=1 Tax=Aurantimonas sp. Leaf443 TaxID=1736378 RepID=UPI0006FFFE19|nr:phosphonate metabolism protein/1,5-bisphosphokinase (PRPP-forming) PhnN [Aurantimonas sp. Leaf443]KQT82177.1 hypothetical protein ASG48_16185 [Aurantimonas sp. Leaf443]
MSPERAAGRLVAVVGPSGAGKDTLLRLAAQALAGRPDVVFARRVVTREADEAAEDHDAMEPDAFAAASRAGAFCLEWSAHGLSYGLPASLLETVRAGGTVVANLSRERLQAAAARFPQLVVVEVTAPRAVLLARLGARGREEGAAVAARLERSVALRVPEGCAARHTIRNDREPAAGAAELVAIIADRPAG